jgi:DNA-binding NarL/FixJ family response regulator
MTNKRIQLMIVDDHQIVIDGIKSSLEEYADITVIAEALNGKEALDKLARQQADIVLMDVDMPVMNGYETACEIASRYPKVKIITLTMFNEKSLINKMLDAGVSGYLLKSVGKEELYRAIKQVFDNKQYLGGDIALSIAKPEYKDILSKQNKITPLTPLSTREIEILQFIAQGLSNTEISQKLFISSRTVDNHRTNIMKKLGVHNIAGIIRYAIQNNIIE